MEALVRQARIDLAAFGADEPPGTAVDPHRVAEVALAQAEVALRYNADEKAPLVRELRGLVEAVTPLVVGVAEPASVA